MNDGGQEREGKGRREAVEADEVVATAAISADQPRQHCRLSICEYLLSLTNTVSEAKIQITLLILRPGAATAAISADRPNSSWVIGTNPGEIFVCFLWQFHVLRLLLQKAKF